jgi:hypothetical protein
MKITLTGSGYGTGEQQTVWFCWHCHQALVLPSGEPHTCKRPKP